MGPLFTIITVCYNSEKTIARTMESMLAQTENDYEYLIIDGASTDRTLDIVREYQPRFAGRMEFISEADQGIYDAMNKGIRLAKGRLIGLLNSDDTYEPDALEQVKHADDGSEYLILYGMMRVLRGEREIGVYLKRHEFIEEDMIAHPACFISRSVYQKYGSYSLEYRSSADYEFMLRIRNEKLIQYIVIYKILSDFSQNGTSGQTRSYMETLKLKRTYGLIGKVRYFFLMFKCRIAMMVGR